MVITFTLEQQSKLLAWAGAITEGHVNADCEPPGNAIELGEVSLQLS